MKKIIIQFSVFFLLLATNVYSQEKESGGVHWGVKAGINIANVSIKSSGLSISASSLIAPTGGLFATIPVGRGGFQIQPELLYSALGFKYKDAAFNIDYTANYNYLVLPVLFKYAIESSGFAAYAGPQLGYLLSAKDKMGATTTDVKADVKSTDLAGIVGLEYTFPMGINISSRYQLGFSNDAKNTSSGESAKLNAITFTLGYRFK